MSASHRFSFGVKKHQLSRNGVNISRKCRRLTLVGGNYAPEKRTGFRPAAQIGCPESSYNKITAQQPGG